MSPERTDSKLRAWRRRLIASSVVAAAVTTLVAQLDSGGLPALHGRPAVTGVALVRLHVLGLAGGLGLLVLAHGLWRGKRRAADVGVTALCLLAAGRLALGLGVLDGGIELALAGLLFANRSAFPLQAQRRAGRLTITLALAAAAGLYAAYAAAVIATTHQTDVDRAVASSGRALLAGASWVSANSSLTLAIDALVALLLVAGAAALLELLRPAEASEGHLPEQHLRAAAIVRAHGHDSLAPFAIREDKALHFAAGGFLAYRVLRETAVVSGDPVGPPESPPRILASFLRLAEQRGWSVVITGASEEHVDGYRELGLRAMRIGEEAIVDPQCFSLEGRAIRKVRQSVTRAQRRGWKVEVVEDQDLTGPLAAELAGVEVEWRSRQPRLQGFAMTQGRLVAAGEDGAGLFVIARAPEGALRAFLRFAAFRGGLSLDLMRRCGDEPNGLTEAMVVAAIEHARATGHRAVSLNFAGFAHLMAADAVLSRSQRAFRLALRALHRRFQLERLHRFNSKFLPAWRTRYLVYGRLTHLPLAALRVLQAEAYLPAPSSPAKPRRWTERPLLPASQTTAVAARVRLASLASWATTAALLCGGLFVAGEPLTDKAHAHPKVTSAHCPPSGRAPGRSSTVAGNSAGAPCSPAGPR